VPGDSAEIFLHIGYMSTPSLSRRSLLKTLTAAAAVLPVCRAPGAEQKRLDVHDPQAAALGYVENADDVDPKKFPRFVKGSTCENCLQLQGKPGNNYRPCNLFSGKLVSVSGWCSGWTAEI
jgi:High potential iron-sulfur protein